METGNRHVPGIALSVSPLVSFRSAENIHSQFNRKIQSVNVFPMEINEVRLDDLVVGKLLVSHLPGSRESFSDALNAINQKEIDSVYCLISDEELKSKSPDYYTAVSEGRFPLELITIPIPSSGVPRELASFVAGIESGRNLLQNGKNLLVHCDSGLGRTATFTINLLIRIGIERLEAYTRLAEAGTGVETSEQEDLIEYLEGVNGQLVGLSEKSNKSS
jgi:protein-tyrosine phosphatase